MAGDDLGGHVGLVDGLVRQHGLAHDVADGVDVRHVGAHLLVHGDEAPVGHRHAGVFRADLPAVGRAPDSLQHQVVALGFLGSGFALEGDPDAVFPGLRPHRPGVEHDVVEAPGVHLVPDLDQVAVGAGHQGGQHLHHVQAGAQRGVDRAHFQADDAAADDQHALGHRFQGQRAGGVDDARIVRQERQLHRLAAGGDDGRGELDRGLAAVGLGHRQVVRIGEGAHALDDRDLAGLGHAGQAAGELAHHGILVAAQLVQVDRRLAEGDAVGGQGLGLFQHADSVQQGLGRDAADVQADPAQGGVAFHQDDLQAQVGGAEGSRVAAGARAQHQDIVFAVGRAGELRGRGGRRRRGRSGCGRGGGRRLGRGGRRRRSGVGGLDADHGRALGDLVAQLDEDFLHHPAPLGRDLHGGLVGFHGDQALFGLDGVARLDQDLDDLDRVEVADVGDVQIDDAHAVPLTG
ncbi:hypothetical protein CDEN61S_00319 [Castellaniella denitrificans]